MGRRKDYPFRKSDIDFGTNLVASVLTLPFALLLSGSSSSANCNYRGNDYKEPTLKDKELEYNIDALLIRNINNKKYNPLKTSYYNDVAESIKIKTELLCNHKKLGRKLKLLRYFGFIPCIKTRITNSITNLETQSKLLEAKYYEPHFLTSKICSSNGHIYTSGYSFVFGELKDYIEYNKRLYAISDATPFISMDKLPIASLNCQYLQLHFFEGCLIIMTQKEFSVIDYDDINYSYDKHILSEVGLNSLDGLKILKEEWAYARVDGGPDRRHKFNYKRYTVEYGALVLDICSQFTVKILFNDYNLGNGLYHIITNNH